MGDLAGPCVRACEAQLPVVREGCEGEASLEARGIHLGSCVRENAGCKSSDGLHAVVVWPVGAFVLMSWEAVVRGSWLADDMLAILGAAFWRSALPRCP
jgi:hypothetical protein